MPDAPPVVPAQFQAEPTYRRHVRLRTLRWIVGSIALALPGLAGLGVGSLLKVVAPEYAALPFGLGFCAALTLWLPALLGLVVAAGVAFEKQTRVEIDADGSLHVPGARVQTLHTRFLRDGYRYAARIDQILVCVPRGRVLEVRRVDDPEERKGLEGTSRPAWGCMIAPFPVWVRSGGHQLSGPGSQEQAPALLQQALRQSWVTDVDYAVAITFDELKADQNVWKAMPERLERPTLYVSVADPDALVAALSS